MRVPSDILASHGFAGPRWVATAILVATCLALSAGCRNYRTLEELEESEARAEALATDPQFAAPDDPLVAQFERVVRLFVDTDATEVIPPRRTTLERRGEHDLLLSLEADRCYAFVAYAHGERIDVDLDLYDPSAQLVAFDRAPDPFPVIPAWCAPESGTYHLQLVASQGSGDALVGAYALPAGLSDAARRIESARATHAEAARALGPVLHASLAERETLSIPIATLPGRCYAVAAVASPGVQDLDLVVVDDHARLQTQDVGTDAAPVIRRVCAERGAPLRLELRTYAGAGDVWWQVFTYDRGD